MAQGTPPPVLREEAGEDAGIQQLLRTKPRAEGKGRLPNSRMELQPLQLPSASCQVVVKCLFLMTEDAVMTDAVFTILQALVRQTQDVSFALGKVLLDLMFTSSCRACLPRENLPF